MLAKDCGASWFQSVCLKNTLTVVNAQLELLERYVGLLLQWNRKVNLISRKDERNVWERHILHSVSLLFKVSIPTDARVMDLGTGGGLPGIPIKILIPTLSLTLVDSIKKKTQAVADIVHQLSLANVVVQCGRAEDLAKREEFRNQFDYVIARGIADLKQLVEWSHPFLKSERYELTGTSASERKIFIRPQALVALKGGNLDNEIESARKAKHVGEIRVIDLSVEGLELAHNPARKAVMVHFQQS